METATKVITAHLPLPLAERVDEMAARLQRSRGWMDRLEAAEAVSGSGRGFAEVQAKYDSIGKAEAAKAAEALKALRANTTLGDISWQELRDAGRR
jgi:predicted transcriptional regulator